MNLFSRREVAVTRSLRELNAVRETLEKNGIGYTVRSGAWASSGRGRGVPFIDPDAVCEYRVYVHRSHLRKALYLLRK